MGSMTQNTSVAKTVTKKYIQHLSTSSRYYTAYGQIMSLHAKGTHTPFLYTLKLLTSSTLTILIQLELALKIKMSKYG